MNENKCPSDEERINLHVDGSVCKKLGRHDATL